MVNVIHYFIQEAVQEYQSDELENDNMESRVHGIHITNADKLRTWKPNIRQS